MKLLALVGAGMIAAGTIAAAPASAQHERHGYNHGYGGRSYGHGGGYGRGYGYRHAYGYRHGYGWRHHGYPRCRVFYRFGHRVRRCY